MQKKPLKLQGENYNFASGIISFWDIFKTFENLYVTQIFDAN